MHHITWTCNLKYLHYKNDANYFTQMQEFSLGIKDNPDFGYSNYMFAGTEQIDEFIKEFKVSQL